MSYMVATMSDVSGLTGTLEFLTGALAASGVQYYGVSNIIEPGLGTWIDDTTSEFVWEDVVHVNTGASPYIVLIVNIPYDPGRESWTSMAFAGSVLGPVTILSANDVAYAWGGGVAAWNIPLASTPFLGGETITATIT